MARRLLLLLALAGCIDNIAEHESPIGSVTHDCVIPGALGAPASLEYPDGSLGLWESAAGTDGAAARVASVDQACRGVALLTDATGAPASVLALTAAERAANAARTDGKRLALAPTGGVVADGVGYV